MLLRAHYKHAAHMGWPVLAKASPWRLGSYDLHAAPILPIVDLNGNGAVDTGDLLHLIEAWGQTDPGFDIGPAP